MKSVCKNKMAAILFRFLNGPDHSKTKLLASLVNFIDNEKCIKIDHPSTILTHDAELSGIQMFPYLVL